MTSSADRDTHAHVARNRSFWDRDADAYQGLHGEDLVARPRAWGAWRRPESELQVLGDVSGKDVLEFGCGAAQWSYALADDGARPVGLDLSAAQLEHARARPGAKQLVPLVLGNAESAPFDRASFDLVFCDHGAMSFCDPEKTVAEAARLLRRRGVLAFCVTHPLVYLTWNARRERQSRKLHMNYDDLGCLDFGDGTVDWVVAPSTWMRLLRDHAFEVELLLELSPPSDATTTYEDFVPYAWARRWPAEMIWRARLV